MLRKKISKCVNRNKKEYSYVKSTQLKNIEALSVYMSNKRAQTLAELKVELSKCIIINGEVNIPLFYHLSL